jgi:hypothetical protein
MAVFNEGFQALAQMGLLDSLLPFLLIFMVVFVAAKQVNIFRDNQNMCTLLALIIALMVVIPHLTGIYPAGVDVVNIINSAFPQVSMVLVAIIAVMLIIGLFGLNFNIGQHGGLTTVFVLASFGTVAYIFGESLGWWRPSANNGFLNFLNDPGTRAILVVVAIFWLVVSFMNSKGSEASGLGKTMKTIADGFKTGFGGK